jgi:PAT family beta-lactamase induction signal transducer AmpG
MLLTQVGLIISIGSLGYIDPLKQTALVAVFASLIAFLSATQDVAIDAFRREILSDEELGLGNSIHVQAYRIASLVPGSLSLILADHLPWVWVFWITAAFMSVGLVLSLSVTEPEDLSPPANNLRETVMTPFKEYFLRVGWRTGLLAMLFMVTYKLGDNMATALATPFYLDLGFSMTEIGVIAKHAALWPSIAGGLLGGLMMLRVGINRALWIFGAVQMVSILGFAWLAASGYSLWLLAVVIGFEYLGVGLGTAAFTAFIARESSRAFAATQFALFTALAAAPRSIASALTGFIVEDVGWVAFFLLCTLLAIPGMVILTWVAPWTRDPVESPTQPRED